MGDTVEARGRDAQKKGHALTAAACLMRAAHYYQTGERFLQHGPRSPEVYKKAVKLFADGAALLKRPRIKWSRFRMVTRPCRRCLCTRRRR